MLIRISVYAFYVYTSDIDTYTSLIRIHDTHTHISNLTQIYVYKSDKINTYTRVIRIQKCTYTNVIRIQESYVYKSGITRIYVYQSHTYTNVIRVQE